MEYQICFCNDGVMRLKYGNKPMIPLSFIQKKTSNKSDFSFWTKWWGSNTIFEDGLTVGSFLSCLSPWSDFWQDLTNKDVKSFIDESKKPTLVRDNSISDNEDNNSSNLSWVSLGYFFDIDLDIEYKKDVEKMGLDINQWLNQKRLARLTGNWDITGYYKLTGYKDGVAEHYSVDNSPMNELAKIPLILNSKQRVYFQDFNGRRILGEKDVLFKEDAFGVRRFKVDSGYEFLYIQGKKYHKLQEVIEGFFFWFPENPIRREEFNEDLRLAINECHMDDSEKVIENVFQLFGEEDSKENKPQKTINAIDEKYNVVPLFNSSSENNDKIKDNDLNSKEDKKLKIKVVPGAFDSLIEQLNRDSEFWSNLLDLASKDNSVMLKIGEFKVGIEPENRLYNNIIKEDDITTPFKEI